MPYRWSITGRTATRSVNVCARTRRAARRIARRWAEQGHEVDIARYSRGRVGPWVEYVPAVG